VTITMPEVADTRARMLRAYRDGLQALIEDATVRPTTASVDEDVLTIADLDGVPLVSRKDIDEALHAIFSQPIPAPSETTVEVSTPATVIVSALCPRCGIAQLIGMSVHPELLIDDEGSELRVKAKSKGVSHTCGQLPLTVVADVADEQTEVLEAIESLVERVHGMLVQIDALPGEEGAEPMPSLEMVASWDRATIDQVDRFATAYLAHLDDFAFAIPPLPRVLGGEADPETVAEDDELAPDVFEDDVDPGDCPFPGCDLRAEHEGDHDVATSDPEP
jgi:hypothetical protein